MSAAADDFEPDRRAACAPCQNFRPAGCCFGKGLGGQGRICFERKDLRL
jgi:hypothetical protein